MYTESWFEFTKQSEFSIHDLNAGIALSEVDTEMLPHPYAPAEVKPIHLLRSVTLEGNDFFSGIVGDEDAVIPSAWCLSGRDGVDLSDWTVTMQDDGECSEDTTLAVNANITSRRHARFNVVNLMVLAVALMILYGIKTLCKSTSNRKVVMLTEEDPLLQSH